LCAHLVNHPHARTNAPEHRDIQRHHQKMKKKRVGRKQHRHLACHPPMSPC
ncbi:hypothetical protein BGY98DRAFT_957261, partial [Russula aff. rugulosa BPL654]